MMSTRYILRFDDICPTMDWTVWEQIESTLEAHGVRPLVAVVPDNRDPDLMVAPARSDFWARVRSWQDKGWTIGLHGYQHRYDTADSGLLGLHARSEFAGHSWGEQLVRLERAIAVFDANGVRADVFVAPSNSFDRATLGALHEIHLTVVSDGYYYAPRRDDLGITWVPQQLWQFRRRPFGLWTICMHHNGWTPADMQRFARHVRRYDGRFTSVADALARGPVTCTSRLDLLFAHLYRAAGRSRNAARTWTRETAAFGRRGAPVSRGVPVNR
jgi:predicted deacetylase